MFPLARTAELSVRNFPTETVIYDLKTNKVHCLNATSTLIWRHCDGRTTLDEMARIVRESAGCESPMVVVQLALEQLSSRNLLQSSVAKVDGPARLSRREALKKLAVAAVAIPVIMSMAAPKAQAAASVGICHSDADCGPPIPLSCQIHRCVVTGNPGTANRTCVTSNSADGTPCGAGKICQGGNCVDIPTPPTEPG